nr:transcription factor MYB 1 [Rheum palmatum]
MTRRCSHCSNNGHNSRTCPSRGGAGPTGGGAGLGCGGVKLFGVRLTDGSFMKKSASMGNLMHYQSSAAAAGSSPNPGSPSSDPHQDPAVPVPDGYLSDDPNHASCSSNRRAERKKGTPWTSEEHRLFLIGLQKLGKGDWRGISRNFVVSRTPTQVASHAQKFFIRQSNASRRKRRSSLFDMVPDMGTDPQPVPEEQMLPPHPPQTSEPTTTNTNSFPSLDLSLGTEAAEVEPMETTSSEMAEEEPSGEAPAVSMHGDLQHPMLPTFVPAFIPYPFAFWPPNASHTENNTMQSMTSNHQVLKPTPVIPKEPVNVDELVGMSKLKLSEIETGHLGPPQLSLNLLGGPSRQSAFHASTAPPLNTSDLAEGKSSVIKAV